jgi:peroxiredoxin
MNHLRLTLLVALAAGATGAVPQEPYRPTAYEQDIDYKLRHLNDRPEGDRPKEALAISKFLHKQRSSPEKVRLAVRLARAARDAHWRDETLQEVVDTLVHAVAEDPKLDPTVQAPANELLAALSRYFDAKVILDTPGYREEFAKVEARTKLRAEVDFTMQDIDGRTWSRSALKGKVVLLNFWGLGCPPCLAEMPWLDRAYRKFQDQGFVVLAVGVDSPGLIREYLAKNPLSFPILSDVDRDLGKKVDVVGIPVNLLYNRTGRLVAESQGAWPEDQLLEKLAQAGLK